MWFVTTRGQAALTAKGVIHKKKLKPVFPIRWTSIVICLPHKQDILEILRGSFFHCFIIITVLWSVEPDLQVVNITAIYDKITEIITFWDPARKNTCVSTCSAGKQTLPDLYGPNNMYTYPVSILRDPHLLTSLYTDFIFSCIAALCVALHVSILFHILYLHPAVSPHELF